MSTVNRRVLPGFGLGLGYTLTYLTILVLVPLGLCFWTAAELSWDDFWKAVADPKAVAPGVQTIVHIFPGGTIAGAEAAELGQRFPTDSIQRPRNAPDIAAA